MEGDIGRSGRGWGGGKMLINKSERK